MNISIEKAVQLLGDGQPVAFPTETVYGLGADAWSADAIMKVFEIKNRPTDNPLIVHIGSRKMVNEFAAEIPNTAQQLMEACWPGPLTLILSKKTEVLDLVTAGLDTVALRWPNHALAQELIYRAGPLVAPSANKSGRPSPTKAEHVTADFGDDFPVLDGGATQIGLESTVLDVTTEPLTIYRPGEISKEKIKKITGLKVQLAQQESENGETRSPGTKYSHYAPEASVQWFGPETESDHQQSLLLFHTDEAPDIKSIIHYHKDYHKMAGELYDRFRQADIEGFEKVIIEPFDQQTRHAHPITEALHNRISKALSKHRSS